MRRAWMIWVAAAVAVVAAFGMSSRLSSDLVAARPPAPLTCNLTNYKASIGLTAAPEGDLLTVSWNGQGTSQVRARFAVDGGTPTIRDWSVRRAGGAWAVADMQKILDAEGGYWYHAHPRTKSTAGFPDAAWGTPYLRNDRYLGVAFKPGMGQDNSEATMCEWRCFDAVDTMNNMNAGLGIGPKYVIADIDTYRKSPEDDLYANFPVNYLKIDAVPGPDQDWSPVLKAMRDGNFFVTTGEILIKNYAVSGRGNQRTITADVEWTFPMAFMEVVTGDGKTVTKQVLSATDLPPFGSKKLSIPFDATGNKWARFAMWDVAGNGAFTQPQWLR